MNSDTSTITTETRGHVFLVGFHRPAKLNSFTTEMLAALGEAYTRYEDDGALRCMVVFAHGKDFTTGLESRKRRAPGRGRRAAVAGDGRRPVGHRGERSRPDQARRHRDAGTRVHAGHELASDVRLCSDDATFAQVEVARGIFPAGRRSAHRRSSAGGTR